MTKKQLIKSLEKFPDNMEVYFRKVDEEFEFVPVEIADTKKVKFTDGGGGKVLTKYEVIVLSDEIF